MFQAELRAAPEVLPEEWCKNDRISGGTPGNTRSFALFLRCFFIVFRNS